MKLCSYCFRYYDKNLTDCPFCDNVELKEGFGKLTDKDFEDIWDGCNI